MECKRQPKSVKIDERSVREQEHRKVSRLLDKVIKKFSATNMEVVTHDDESKGAGVRFTGTTPTHGPCKGKKSEEAEAEEMNAIAQQRKMAKMKSFAKRKSPLQKFDEVVTRELTNRQNTDSESICPFDGGQKWPSNLDFSCGKVTPSDRKVAFDTKMSKTALYNAERELKNKDRDPCDVEDQELMDAIEKLIMAQASCRFDAAVKAADAAASSVPLELAEEVAITCAKDYQSEIIDIFNERVAADDGKKPMEVIGYIGITKRKEPPEDE